MTRTRQRATVVAGAGLLLAGVLPVAGAGASGGGGAAAGTFALLPAGVVAAPALAGRAHLVRTEGGDTVLSVHLTGLQAGETYGVHLHREACAPNAGGGHYQDVPGGPAAPPNELWASSDPHTATAGVTADAAGVAHGRGRADWTARSTARSVVVHTGLHAGGTVGGGVKLACADLH